MALLRMPTSHLVTCSCPYGWSRAAGAPCAGNRLPLPHSAWRSKAGKDESTNLAIIRASPEARLADGSATRKWALRRLEPDGRNPSHPALWGRGYRRAPPVLDLDPMSLAILTGKESDIRGAPKLVTMPACGRQYPAVIRRATETRVWKETNCRFFLSC